MSGKVPIDGVPYAPEITSHCPGAVPTHSSYESDADGVSASLAAFHVSTFSADEESPDGAPGGALPGPTRFSYKLRTGSPTMSRSASPSKSPRRIGPVNVAGSDSDCGKLP